MTGRRTSRIDVGAQRASRRDALRLAFAAIAGTGLAASFVSNAALAASLQGLHPLPLPIDDRASARLTGNGRVSVLSGQLPPLTEYTVEAEIDFEAGTIFASEAIRYSNPTTRVLDTVVLTAIPLAFDAMTVLDLAVDGASVTPAIDGISIDVPLGRGLAPGEAVRIDLVFTISVPRIPGRFGYYRDIMSLGNWLPVVAPYRQGRLITEGREEGFNRYRYTDYGDAFFTETASFRVGLRLAEHLRVAHTGTAIFREGERLEIYAPLVRDFALAISDRFELLDTEVDGVILTSFFLPEHRAGGQLMLQAAAAALGWLNRYLGQYPYPSLHVAEMGDGSSGTSVGQEYPNLVLISAAHVAQPAGIASYLAYLTIHEVAHQWFYGLVGNDQIYEPWLDEALVSWITLQYYREHEPALYPGMFSQRITALLGAAGARPDAHPVDSSVYQYADENTYFAAVYRRGTLFFEEVYQILGPSEFAAALHDYVRTFTHRVATPSALLAALQERSPTSLWELYGRYFSYRELQLPPPEPVGVTVPNSVTAGQITVDIQATDPSALEAEVSLNDRPYFVGPGAEQLTIWLGPTEGEHLVTVRLRDDLGRTTETNKLVRFSQG